MKIKTVSIIQAALLFALLTFVTVTAHGQTNQPANLITALQSVFDANDTNSLMHANEINISTAFKWDSEAAKAGALLKLDWWITDQQGAFFSFEEYGNRESYWALGYQARTVLRGLEVGIGSGVRQNTSNPFGDVQLFLQPSITKQIFAKGDWDIRVMAGCDILNASRPNPFVGFTVRAKKF